MHTMEVLEPSGATEITKLHAPRLDSLEGKTIGLMSNESWQSHRTLPLIKDYLEKRFPNITVLSPHELPSGPHGAIDTDEVASIVKERGVDAVIIGNAA